MSLRATKAAREPGGGARAWSTALLLLAVLVSCPPISADVPLDPENPKPWYHHVALLEREGVAADVASVIEAVSTNPDFLVRWVAADLLGERRDHEAVEALRTVVFTDEAWMVRTRAALALARLGECQFVGVYRWMMLRERRLAAKLRMATDLARLGDFRSYELVVAAARSEDPRLRFSSAGALGVFVRSGLPASAGEPSPIDLVRTLLRDEKADVRREALRTVEGQWSSGVPVAALREVVREMATNDPDQEIRDLARSRAAVEDPWRLKKPEHQCADRGTAVRE